MLFEAPRVRVNFCPSLGSRPDTVIQWKYLYRAVDKAGNTVDFLLTAKRDRKAALRFLSKAPANMARRRRLTIDKSSASTAAIESNNAEHDTEVEIRQVKYLNNIVEQDHRAIKRQVRPMMGFKSFWYAAVTLAGIELMHMIRKGQLKAARRLRPASQFYSLAGCLSFWAWRCSAATQDLRQNPTN